MRKTQILRAIYFLLFLFVTSCQSKNNQTRSTQKKALTSELITKTSKKNSAEFDKVDLTKDFITYWSYHYTFVKLFKDFIPLDTSGNVIAKKKFLQKVSEGMHFPLLHSTKDKVWQYELVAIPQNVKKEIGPVVAAYGERQLAYFNQEKTQVPYFKFEDVNGVEYSSTNTKGKILILKCWFLACHACVLEIPALNQMVQKYKNRKDIVFLSLVSDEKAPVKEFLEKTLFDYPVVASQDNFITEKLRVNTYPTHFLIDKQGKIVKIVNEASDLEELLALAVEKKN
ncbi:peroxiredoxin [Pedobacter sp. UYEF25]